MEYMLQQAVKLDFKTLIDNKSKFVLCHSSSGFKHSLKGRLFVYLLIVDYLLIVGNLIIC